LNESTRSKIIEDAPFHLSAPTDDKPFMEHFFRLATVFSSERRARLKDPFWLQSELVDPASETGYYPDLSLAPWIIHPLHFAGGILHGHAFPGRPDLDLKTFFGVCALGMGYQRLRDRNEFELAFVARAGQRPALQTARQRKLRYYSTSNPLCRPVEFASLFDRYIIRQ
jgi:hypothetical protein